MTIQRDHPYTGAHFLVSIGEADSRDAAAGFAEVVFPPFVRRLSHTRSTGARRRAAASAVDGPVATRLVLRRGVCGSLDLYSWWDEARRKRTPKTRTVTVELLSDDHARVVLTWRFLGAYPVSLAYSPLSAMGGAVLMETVELAFADVEMT